jgi:DNA polymerase-3 subunit delta'
MRFPGFYGNVPLKTRLSAGRLSHCYILEGPAGSGKKTLARILAASLVCESDGNRPCGQCSPCHKALVSGHPDIITVDSDTATVPIRVIRQMQADAYIKPNEADRKIYILPRAQDMQPPAQNALLKLLEEPPSYCVFFLLTDSGDKLLETVRSRAVTLTLAPLSQSDLLTALKEKAPGRSQEEYLRACDRSGGYLGQALTILDTPDTAADHQAQELLEAFSSGDEAEFVCALVPLEKAKRQDLLNLLSLVHRTLVRAMDPGSLKSGTAQSLSQKCTPAQLYTAAQAVSEAITRLQANVSAGHTVGFLMAEMRSFY